MKVKLELQNIGGLRGNHSFQFETGKVNILEAPNAIGKSSMIRGLTAVLSAPFLGSLVGSEADGLGLAPEALINVYEDEASAALRIGEETKEFRVRRDGKLLKNPHSDSRFLFAGLLTREAKLIRHLLSGDDDFYWIVSIMSLADEFKRVSDIVERRLSEVSLKIGELRRRIKDQEQLRKELSKMEMERGKLEEEYEKLQKELNQIPTEDPKLKSILEEVNQLRKKERGTKTSIGQLTKSLDSDKRNLRMIQRNFKDQKDKCEKLRSEVRNTTQKLEALSPDKAYELDRLMDSSKSMIETLREDRMKCEVELNLYSSALQGIDESLEEVACPLCGSSTIPVRKIKEKIERIRRRVGEVNSEINKAMKAFDQSVWKRDQIVRDREELEQTIENLRNELKGDESKLLGLKEEVSDSEKKVEARKTELNAKRNEYKLLQERMIAKYEEKENYEEKRGVKKREKLAGRLLDISREIGGVEQRILEIKERLSEISDEYIAGTSVSLERAIQIYEKFWTELKVTLDDIRRIADGERKGVAREFNSRIKEILNELGFKEFQDIFLNEDTYRLQVYRQGEKYQPIPSLSTAERSVIATVLQIAMKMTYLPEAPYFIIDAVALDFDKSKVVGVMNYLARLAEERDWLAILTRLSERESLAIQVYEPKKSL